MNIFILDTDIHKCAEYMVDKHVVKMITEHAQILSTVCRLNGQNVGYRATHIHHPTIRWCKTSLSNWIYLRDLTKCIHEEWKLRYPKNPQVNHKSYDVMKTLPYPNIPDIGLTTFAQAMPVGYYNEDAVEAYRAYYMGEKRHIASWTNRSVPEWWE